MDKDTAVKAIRNNYMWGADGNYKYDLSDDIADFIEQQEKEITTLRQYREEDIKMRLLANKLKNGEMKIKASGLVFKDNGEDLERELQEELKKIRYAELGRLVVNENICYWDGREYSDSCPLNGKCDKNKICQKRAELLAEVSL